jgi:NAD-dependent dihydropyrimidine dehydrogenase PreA subunit
MTFVITLACVDKMERACLEVCPVDCIYEGDRKMYINPIECVNCGACEDVCPHEAAQWESDLPDDPNIADNARFFTEILATRVAPEVASGGARRVGRVGADTSFVVKSINEGRTT